MNYILEGINNAFFLILSGDPETFSAIFTTIKASGLSMFASLVLGIPAGFLLGHNEFHGKSFIKTIVNTLLALPTVVIGLIVYMFISRSGPFGEYDILFSIYGIAIGQFILALPIVIALTAAAIENQDQSLKLTLMTFGANKIQIAKTILWEAKYAVSAAAVTAFGRVVSEVGISMMVGGNIKWHTRTITTAITLETGKGQFSEGIALGIILLLFALIINICNTIFTNMNSKGRATDAV